MLETQACLTNDPNDKEPFHKKQPTAVSSSEVWKQSDNSNHPPFKRTTPLMSFWLKLARISPNKEQPRKGELMRREVVLEPFPTTTEYTIVGTTHQITTYLSSFGKMRKMRTRLLSLPKLLKRIFSGY